MRTDRKTTPPEHHQPLTTVPARPHGTQQNFKNKMRTVIPADLQRFSERLSLQLYKCKRYSDTLENPLPNPPLPTKKKKVGARNGADLLRHLKSRTCIGGFPRFFCKAPRLKIAPVYGLKFLPPGSFPLSLSPSPSPPHLSPVPFFSPPPRPPHPNPIAFLPPSPTLTGFTRRTKMTRIHKLLAGFFLKRGLGFIRVSFVGDNT